MFKTTFFDHWVKYHLWSLSLQLHWFINHFQCVRARSLKLIYIRWIWAAQSKFHLLALKNLLFYIYKKEKGNWHKRNNFVIAALYFINFNYWYGKWYMQYFSKYFLNHFQLSYIDHIDLWCFLQDVFETCFHRLLKCTCFYFIKKI